MEVKMKKTLSVVGITVDQRSRHASEVQEIITRYGSDIIGRMGVPSPDKQKGLITLVFDGPETSTAKFYDELQTIADLEVKVMRFSD
jgi:putative iron-only hydrogenase system regulator